MKIVVIGGSGLIGSKVVSKLRELFRWNPTTTELTPIRCQQALPESASASDAVSGSLTE